MTLNFVFQINEVLKEGERVEEITDPHILLLHHFHPRLHILPDSWPLLCWSVAQMQNQNTFRIVQNQSPSLQTMPSLYFHFGTVPYQLPSADEESPTFIQLHKHKHSVSQYKADVTIPDFVSF